MKRRTKKIKLPGRICKDSGKRIHTNQDSAEVHMRNLLSCHKADKRTIHTYECPCCLGWHVGHSQ